MPRASVKKARIDEQGTSVSPNGNTALKVFEEENKVQEEESVLQKRVLQYGPEFEKCERKSFVGATDLSTNAVVYVMNTKKIPCCVQACDPEGKNVGVPLALLYVKQAGKATAPFVKPKAGKPWTNFPDSKSLTVMGDNKNVELKLFPYSKVNDNASKGPVIEKLQYTLECGDVITFWVGKDTFTAQQQYMFQPQEYKKEPLLPTDIQVIEPFTLLEVHVTSKIGDDRLDSDNEKVPRDRNVKISMIRVCKHTLYSIKDVFGNIADSRANAVRHILEKKKQYPIIASDLETGCFVFFVPHVRLDAYVSDENKENGEYHVVDWNLNHDPENPENVVMNISLESMLKYTNACDVQWALTMLQIAINMGCVSFLCFYSDFFRKRGDNGSGIKAIPLIDTKAFFRSVELDSDLMRGVAENTQKGYYMSHFVSGETARVSFNTGLVRREEDGAEKKIVLSVVLPEKPLRLEGGEAPCKDLIVCGKQFAVPSALQFHVSVVDERKEGNEDKEDIGIEVDKCVLTGYFRTDAMGSNPCEGFRRAAFGCVEEKE